MAIDRTRLNYSRIINYINISRGSIISLPLFLSRRKRKRIFSASCNRDFTHRVIHMSRVYVRALAHSRDRHSYSEGGINTTRVCARVRAHARTHARTHTGKPCNDPVNPPSSHPAVRHSFVATRGAFIYLRNTSRDSIWYMCMLTLR